MMCCWRAPEQATVQFVSQTASTAAFIHAQMKRGNTALVSPLPTRDGRGPHQGEGRGRREGGRDGGEGSDGLLLEAAGRRGTTSRQLGAWEKFCGASEGRAGRNGAAWHRLKRTSWQPCRQPACALRNRAAKAYGQFSFTRRRITEGPARHAGAPAEARAWVRLATALSG